MLFCLIFIGSAIFVSNFVLQVRRRAFEHKFVSIIEARARKDRRSFSRSSAISMPRLSTAKSREPGTSDQAIGNRPYGGSLVTTDTQSPTRRGRALRSKPSLHLSASREIDQTRSTQASAKDDCSSDDEPIEAVSPDRITFSPETRFRGHDEPGSPIKQRHRVFSVSGVGARSDASLHRTTSASRTSIAIDDAPVGNKDLTADYFPSSGYISRNSQFHNLTEAERQRLGGVEYKALLWLSWIVPLYLILWQLLGALGCAAWVARNQPDTARSNGLNPWYVISFNKIRILHGPVSASSTMNFADNICLN